MSICIWKKIFTLAIARHEGREGKGKGREGRIGSPNVEDALTPMSTRHESRRVNDAVHNQMSYDRPLFNYLHANQAVMKRYNTEMIKNKS
jgi:hypothetical protein